MKSIPKRLMLLAILWRSVAALAVAGPSTGWYEEARFGMFIHWGLYSQAANNWEGQRYYGIGEWLMKRAKIPREKYAELAKSFNPVKFDADAWVLAAKDAGMGYLIIGAKHHDGFAIFDSAASPYNIVAATPFGRDPLKELAEACRRHGIRLGFYYSQTQDWYEPDAVGNDWDFDPSKAVFQRYLNGKVEPQLRELLTGYGDISILWFDTPQDIAPEESRRLVDFVHGFQPGCLTTSRVGNGLGDYICLGDHELPTRVADKPVEALFTHNDSWGYTDYDKNFRSPREIVELLVRSASFGANLLFNIGPKADGTFPAESLRDLRTVGAWMRRNGESIRGSGPSPFPPMPWGVATTRPGRLFLHVLEAPPTRELRVPAFSARPIGARLLVAGLPLRMREDSGDLVVTLPVDLPDELVTVVEVTHEGALTASSDWVAVEGMPLALPGRAARLAGRTSTEQLKWTEEFGDWKHAEVLTEWTAQADSAAWSFRTVEAERYYVHLDYAFAGSATRGEGVVTVGGERLFFETLPSGNRPHHFLDHRIGIVTLPPGRHELTVAPAGAGPTFIGLREVRLVPVR